MRIFLLTFLTVCVFRVSAAPETPFRHGRLDNGLTYYIRATGASAGKADFYLVQNVGALMEEEHQTDWPTCWSTWLSMLRSISRKAYPLS